MGGRIVQLVQGEKLKLAFDDFEYWIERFSKYPVVQLIDLDAAMRQGDNRALIEMICKRLPCQVGGGLKSAEDGRALLAAGAKRVIYGSSLFGAGTMSGFPMDVAAVLRSTTAKQLIVAGGIKERAEVDALDAMGVDAVAGMAVYSGAMEA